MEKVVNYSNCQKCWAHKIIYAFLFIESICGFSACSSNDEENIFTDVEVCFSLLNAKGENCTTFKYGEKIYFDLVVKNKTDKNVYLRDNVFYNTYNINAFAVYTDNGLFVGYPFDGVNLSADKYLLLPKATIHWQSCWGMNPAESKDYDPFITESQRLPLAQGEYYTAFSFLYNGDRKVYKVFFKISE